MVRWTAPSIQRSHPPVHSLFPLASEEPVVPGEVSPPELSRGVLGTFTSRAAETLHLHVMEHEDVRPYRCRLCYFDCTQLRDLEAHLTDKHHVRICSEASLSSPPHFVSLKNEVFPLSVSATFPLNSQALFGIDSY